MLYIFPPKLIFKFIEENSALVESLIDTVASSVPFALSKLYDGLTDDQKELEVNLKQLLDDTKVVDKPAMCGPNIARLLTTGYDALLLIVSKRGLSTEYNKQIYNDSPKYFGRDLYNVMCEAKITDQIVSFFPEDFMLFANYNEA